MKQWYINNPQLLKSEKELMEKCRPDFKLKKLKDGCLCWVGSVKTGLEGFYPHKTNEYMFRMVYSPVYPNHYAGCPLRTYLIIPEVKDIINDLGFFPLEVRIDNAGEKYIDFCDYTDDSHGMGCTRAVHQAYLMSIEMLALEIFKSGQCHRETILKKREYGLNGTGIPHWHEINPNLLELEKKAMSIEFPDFKYDSLDDGRISWKGNFFLSSINCRVPIIVEYDKHHPNYNIRKSISIYIEDADYCITRYGFYKLSFESDDNPLGLSAHLRWDNIGRIGISLQRKHGLNNSALHNAVYELRLLKVWFILIQIRVTLWEEQNRPIEWIDIERANPNIRERIEKILYGKI